MLECKFKINYPRIFVLLHSFNILLILTAELTFGSSSKQLD